MVEVKRVADDESDEPERAVHYRMVVLAVGAHYNGRIELTAEDPLEFEPEYIDRGGYAFERYGEADDYVEVRRDLVVERSLTTFDPDEIRADSEPASADRISEGDR